MSKLGINTGSNPNDGQGDPLRIAMGKINSNFTEIYDTLGDGNNIISYASTAGISTLARNLTGSPRINVSGILNTGITTTEHLEVRNITSTGIVTATQFIGDGSQLTNVTALVGGLEVLDDNVRKGVARELNFGANIVSTGPDGVGRVTISVGSSIIISGIVTTADYARVAGYSTSSGIATVAQGLTGTPNLNVGVVTATSYRGSGTNLTGIITTLVAGSNVTITQSSGIATISASGGGGSGAYATIAGYSTSSGIATVAQGLTGTPNISVNQVGISSFLSVSGITSFFNDVHFEYDRAVLIGNNDELQLYHNGANSYIDNSSGGNLIIRAHGGSIQLQKETPELMGVFNTDGGVELYYNNSNKFETTGYGVTIFGGLNATGVVTALSFRPSGGYIQAADGTNSFYIYSGTGDVAFQGKINTSQINSGSGYKALDFGATTTPSVNITNSLNVGSGASITGVVTATSFSGSGTNLTGIITSLVAGTNVTITQSSGIATISASGGGGGSIAGIDTTGTSFFNQLNVSGVSTFSGITTNTSTLFANQLSVSGVSTFAGITTVTGVSLFSRQLSVSGVSTFAGITTVTGVTLFAKQLDVAGVSTFAGITTVTGVTLFAKQLNVSGIATASSFVGAGTSLTGLDASNISLGTLTNSRLPSDISVSGVVTATRFESTSGGTPTIGAATTISLETIKVAISTDVTVGRNANVSGIVTATGGFISVGNTTPIQISLVGNQLTFTAVGIGSTTLTLF